MVDPVSVRTPVVPDASQDPVIDEVSVKARTSSADWKPEEMVTVADSMLVSSASVMAVSYTHLTLPTKA